MPDVGLETHYIVEKLHISRRLFKFLVTRGTCINRHVWLMFCPHEGDGGRKHPHRSGNKLLPLASLHRQRKEGVQHDALTWREYGRQTEGGLFPLCSIRLSGLFSLVDPMRSS
ncbi:Uncharacterized protein Fot_42696 [Forsythia ovata]|uniref:Uncharacterized protein n=1 Tax=Forsythia ovata TaxID=205694 RepID=A0ABD1RMW7_9LAMI